MSFGKLAEAVHKHQPTTYWHRPNHLAAIDVAENFYGLEPDDAPVTRAEAMSVPAMARARHVICTAARLPVVVTPASYANDALIRQPDPTRTRTAVHTETLDSIIFHGAAVWRVTERYADARPRHAEVIPLHSLTFAPESGEWRYADRPIPRRDLLFFEGPHEGILSFGRRALRAALNIERAYAATATNPAVAAELHQTSADTLSDAEIAALVSNVRTAIRTRGVVYTNEALELRMHAAEAENLLISGRQAAAVDIARTVGLPAPIIDAYPAGSSGTYANHQARLREARDIGGIDAYADAITARLSMDDVLPRGVSCAYLWDRLVRPDFADRMNGYNAALSNNIYSLEEVRAMEERANAAETERA